MKIRTICLTFSISIIAVGISLLAHADQPVVSQTSEQASVDTGQSVPSICPEIYRSDICESTEGCHWNSHPSYVVGCWPNQ
jgi:hypothetical protein